MNILQPVIELGPEVVVVSGAMSADDIRALVMQLAENAAPDGRDAASASTDEALSWVLTAAHDDAVLVVGGLRAVDGAGFRVDPSCCCDLNSWRDWTEFADRPEIWLGHDPDPWIEYHDTGLRVHADRTSASKGYVEIASDELPHLLDVVRQDLLGLLDAVTAWTAATAPGREVAFTGMLDQILHITEPLPWTHGTVTFDQ